MPTLTLIPRGMKPTGRSQPVSETNTMVPVIDRMVLPNVDRSPGMPTLTHADSFMVKPAGSMPTLRLIPRAVTSALFSFEFDVSEFEPKPVRPKLLKKEEPAYRFFRQSASCNRVLPCPFKRTSLSPSRLCYDFPTGDEVTYLNIPQFPVSAWSHTPRTPKIRRISPPQSQMSNLLRVQLLKRNFHDNLRVAAEQGTMDFNLEDNELEL